MWDFFFPCIFWVSQNFHICTQLPGVLGRKRKELERKFSFLLLPFTGLCPDGPGIRQPSVLLRLCPQVSEACSPSLRKEKITRVLRKHNLFLLQVLQPESTMWTQRHLQVVVENAALGGIPSPVVGWVLGSMKK